MNLNKVILAGNLTRDPELKYTQNGTAVCSFGLAINRKYTTASGETREDTCFVDCTAWGKTGERVAQHMRKGCGLLVDGRLQLDTWEDRATGQKRSKLTVTADNVQFLGTPQEQDAPRGYAKRQEHQQRPVAPGRQAPQRQPATSAPGANGYGSSSSGIATEVDDPMGDIPF